MKQKLLVLLTTILSSNCFAQILFEKGYYIDNSNHKVDCFIKNIEWKNNPNKFLFKLTEDGAIQTNTLSNVKEFGINSSLKYLRSPVKIDMSSDNISNLSAKRTPIFVKKVVFLKTLVEGEASLYVYEDTNVKRFFIKKQSSNEIEALVSKKYLTKDNKVADNLQYKQQLLNSLTCSSITLKTIKNLLYTNSKLISLFDNYNTCSNPTTYVNSTKKQRKDLININLRPRYNLSSFSIKNASFENRNVDFGNKSSFGLGIEIEYILPFNKNKWGVSVEPTYQEFSATRNRLLENSNLNITNRIDYQSIEIPLSLRHYLFINEQSKLFVNFSFIIDLTLKSNYQFSIENNLDIRDDLISGTNFALGFGYKFNDKYSIEIRQQSERNLLNKTAVTDTSFRAFSVIIGYSFL